MSFKYAVNDQIRTREVRLIAENGDQIGIISTIEAKRRAADVGLDLVAINEADGVPVCKILDFGKFRYDQIRKEKDAAKKSRESRVELKEIQLRPTTDTNDIAIKAKRAQGFLTDGDKVKVLVKFKGREISHSEIGRKVINAFLDNLVDYKLERPISFSERQLFTILAPLPKKTEQS